MVNLYLRSNMIETVFYYLGLVGVISVLTAYLLLQMHKIKPDSYTYSWLNLIGAGLVLVSLFFVWNLPAALVEMAWMLISIYGLIKRFFYIREHKKKA